MFVIDDVLFSPFRALMHIVRNIYEAAQQEAATEAEAIRLELSELYMLLETERITEKEFNFREAELLDKLEAAASRSALSKTEVMER